MTGLSFERFARIYSTASAFLDSVAASLLIQRFLLHVLPVGFHKIRHFGLYSPAYAKHREALARKLPTTRPATEAPKPAVPPTKEGWEDQLERLTGVDIRRCPRCDGVMVRRSIPRPRGPPGGL